jgi:hypothetical protein
VPGTLVMILVPILVRIDKPDLTLLKGADYLGMVLMALCLGTLQYVLEEGARWTGSATTRSESPPGSRDSPASGSSSEA